MRDAFVKKLFWLAEQDSSIFLITGDLGYGIFEPFEARFPHQFLNAGVAEQNMTGLATGMALDGHKVFTYSIGNFPTLRCLEQLRNDTCYHHANVNIVASGGGFSYGALGMSHHATEDLSIMRALPGVVVTAPGTSWEAGQATLVMPRHPGIVYLRLDKSAAKEIEPPDARTFILGKARRLREGSDATLICCGGILEEALSAASDLALYGIECRVVSMHTIKPLDKAEVESATLDTGGIFTIEENNILGGMGGAVSEFCLEHGLYPGFFHRIGLNDTFPDRTGSQQYLRKRYGMDCKAITEKVLEFVKERGSWSYNYESVRNA